MTKKKLNATGSDNPEAEFLRVIVEVSWEDGFRVIGRLFSSGMNQNLSVLVSKNPELVL